jgi:hypothetical protein
VEEVLEIEDEVLELDEELLLAMVEEVFEIEDEELVLEEEDGLMEGDELSLLAGPLCNASTPAVTPTNPSKIPKNFLFKNQAAGFFFFSSFSLRLSF